MKIMLLLQDSVAYQLTGQSRGWPGMCAAALIEGWGLQLQRCWWNKLYVPLNNRENVSDVGWRTYICRKPSRFFFSSSVVIMRTFFPPANLYISMCKVL